MTEERVSRETASSDPAASKDGEGNGSQLETLSKSLATALVRVGQPSILVNASFEDKVTQLHLDLVTSVTISIGPEEDKQTIILDSTFEVIFPESALDSQTDVKIFVYKAREAGFTRFITVEPLGLQFTSQVELRFRHCLTSERPRTVAFLYCNHLISGCTLERAELWNEQTSRDSQSAITVDEDWAIWRVDNFSGRGAGLSGVRQLSLMAFISRSLQIQVRFHLVADDDHESVIKDIEYHSRQFRFHSKEWVYIESSCESVTLKPDHILDPWTKSEVHCNPFHFTSEKVDFFFNYQYAYRKPHSFFFTAPYESRNYPFSAVFSMGETALLICSDSPLTSSQEERSTKTEEPQLPQLPTPSPPRTGNIRVLVLSSEWASSKGGLSTFNRLLCAEALSKAQGVDVTCAVHSFTKEDYDSAAAVNVQLTTFLLHRDVVDVVVGHQQVTGHDAQEYAHSFGEAGHRVCHVHFFHTWPEDLERFKGGSDAELKAEEKMEKQQSIAKKASVAACVGPFLFKKWDARLRGENMLRFTPGLINPSDGVHRIAGEVTIITMGRLDDPIVKGVDTIIASLEHIKEKGHSYMKFVFRGTPEDQVKEQEAELRKIYKNAYVRKFDSLPGKIDDDLLGVDLLLMPSRGEAFGLVALEALSKGIPVIASYSSGFAMCIQEIMGEVELDDWFISDEEGAEVLADKIIRIVGTEEQRKASFEKANDIRKKYDQKFKWKQQAEALLQKCREFLDQ